MGGDRNRLGRILPQSCTTRSVASVPGAEVRLVGGPPPGPPAAPVGSPFTLSRPSALVLCVAGLAVACSSASPKAALPPTSAPSTAPAPTTPVATTVPLPPRPYPITTTTLALVDPNRPTVSRGHQMAPTRALTTVVWYPTVGTSWPLVVFVPGYQVGPDSYSHLLQTWAAAGYVVAAIEFPLSDAAVAGAALDENDLNNQPSDVRFVMDALITPSGPLAARIDYMRMGVAGHSDGAEAALAVAQQGDVTIKAVIAMSGQPVIPHLAPNPPLLVAQGDVDTINPPVRSQAIFDQATSPRFLLTLKGAGHLAPFAGGTRWQPAVDQVTVDFLDHYLARATDSDVMLLAHGNRPGLTTLVVAG